jgi:hypothetical protein
MNNERNLRAWAIAIHLIAIAGGIYLGILIFNLATTPG